MLRRLAVRCNGYAVASRLRAMPARLSVATLRVGRLDAAVAGAVSARRALASTSSSSSSSTPAAAWAAPLDTFPRRHIGPSEEDVAAMLSVVGHKSMQSFMDAVVPPAIRLGRSLNLRSDGSQGEHGALRDLAALAERNTVHRSFIGAGFYGTLTPHVITRNLLESPAWYTPYTPYQAEVAQGRLESLLNFQTMVADLTGMQVANSSLLDEATAAGEAFHMVYNMRLASDDDASKRYAIFVDEQMHPQTVALLRGRTLPFGVKVIVGDPAQPLDGAELGGAALCAVFVQYPSTVGQLRDVADIARRTHAAGAKLCVAADLLAATVLKPPGELGADVVFGSSQRFGVPMGYGGPHAAFFATTAALARRMPGRIIGVSKDSAGRPALRMALQTREQHIRRDKATSNICTAQALLANVAAMYGVYHGPAGLRAIAERVVRLTATLAESLRRIDAGHQVPDAAHFDTLCVRVHGAGNAASNVVLAAEARGVNLRLVDAAHVGISLDETATLRDVVDIVAAFASQGRSGAAALSGAAMEAVVGAAAADAAVAERTEQLLRPHRRTSAFMEHPVFNSHRSETAMMRYMAFLSSRDLGLQTAAIPLGSCTMKLNAAAEMLPVTWPQLTSLHPFVPAHQAAGSIEMIDRLSASLLEITGFDALAMQPNAGSAGEYCGLMVIGAYFRHKGEAQRDVVLIPASAHGTNPASAVVAGFKVVVVACEAGGDVSLADLKAKLAQYDGRVAAIMITYPSTYGVFEVGVRDVCDLVHGAGGQVYMDGANMNAQVGVCRPADIGADVCHLNLHKTFCIPHGGGGPGMGPIGVKKHLAPFLPRHPYAPAASYAGVAGTGPTQAIENVSAAPFGSSMILPIPYMYITMMGPEGLRRATEVAILSANYALRRLEKAYRCAFRSKAGYVAHECIIDFAEFKQSAGVEVEDIAKRLIDYGLHPPTMSWPVQNTMMLEFTESEPKEEVDRVVDALLSIREEIRDIEQGKADRKDNLLKNAPHTMHAACGSTWSHTYSREAAVFPTAWTKSRKFWPAAGRVDNVAGDRNLVCVCPPVSDYQ